MNEELFVRSGRLLGAWTRMVANAAGFVVQSSTSLFVEADAASEPRRGSRGRAGTGERRRLMLVAAALLLAARAARSGDAAARDTLDRLGRSIDAGPEERALAERLYRLARSSAASVDAFTLQLSEAFGRSTAFIETLVRGAPTGGRPSDDRSFFERVAEMLGMDPRGFGGFAGAAAGGPEADPYRVLGVPPGATEEEVRAAYRMLVREHHPDRLTGAGHPADEIRLSVERMVEINAAYAKLTRPKSA
jgi:DnaJ like chaperone protein